MSQIEINDTIFAGDREFIVNTNFDEDKKHIVAKVSENSHILNTYHYPVRENLLGEELENFAREKHQTVLSDWELLFYVHDKVKLSNHASSLDKLGLILLYKNLVQEAIECLTMAIIEDENFIDAHIHLGQAYIRAEVYSEAIEILNKALELSPDYADLYLQLGIAHLKNHEFQQAVNRLEKALEINPQYDYSHYMLSRAYLLSIAMKLDSSDLLPVSIRQKKITSHLQKAMDLNSFFDQANVRQAMKEIMDENFEAAVILLEEVDIGLDKEKENNFDDEFYLNFMFGGKSKDDKVISNYIGFLQRRTQKKPNFPDVHNNLGIAYLIQCRNMFLKAIEQFRIALKINPNFRNAKKNLKIAENEGKGFIILLRALLK